MLELAGYLDIEMRKRKNQKDQVSALGNLMDDNEIANLINSA